MRSVVIIAIGLALGTSTFAASAWAHSGGVSNNGCGCHGSGDVDLSITADVGTINPGQTVTMLVSIAADANEAGLFLQANAGESSTLAGQGLAEVPAGLTHTQPKAISGGQAQFAFEWTAPDVPGAVRFDLWGVAANGNNSSSGDRFDEGSFDFVYGCEPQMFWRDFDGDGFGRTNLPRIYCAGAAPEGYAAEPDDCDDNRAETYPGADEFCNQVDDDCDDEVDEAAIPVELYPDADGDGYYGSMEFESGEMMIGCVGISGFAAEPGDCRPEDPAIHPGAEEVCNGFDDDCDADVDERVRPQCGEGWCRRDSINCEAAACMPGEPRTEECNFFDDDCDGIVDEDAPCPEGSSCQAGECRPDEGGPDDGGPDEGGLDDGGGATTTGPGGGSATGTGAGATAGQSDAGDGGSGCRVTFPGGGTLWLVLLGVGAVWRRRPRP